MQQTGLPGGQAPIGIFDSGIGGLTVLQSIRELLPWESLFYLGDMARVPYGNRSPETVTRYALECGTFLWKRGVKLLVVACNTASALSLGALAQALPIPVVGVLQPAVQAALRKTTHGKIGVIGTEATIRSGAYERAIHALHPGIQVYSQACPLLVPLIEEGWLEDGITRQVAQRYLAPLQARGIDTLILGCTHYPLLQPLLEDLLGDEVSLIPANREAALEVRNILEKIGLLQGIPQIPRHRYFVTDAPERFRRIGEQFLQEPIREVEWVELS